MKKRYVVLVLALAVALTAALPAVGASPAQLAEKALGLAKKANKRAKKADAKATAAQSTATGARSAASAAQTTADSARSAAGSAQARANSAATAAAAARTFARQVYRDAGVDLPAGVPLVIATMSNVTPGSYVIQAKTDVFAGGTGVGVVQCEVNAGGDTDFANTFLGDGGSAVFEATLQASVVHTFTTPGSITLRCTNSMPATATATAQETKIIAIKVGDITNNTAVTG
jgi:hypothetical protein